MHLLRVAVSAEHLLLQGIGDRFCLHVSHWHSFDPLRKGILGGDDVAIPSLGRGLDRADDVDRHSLERVAVHYRLQRVSLG